MTQPVNGSPRDLLDDLRRLGDIAPPAAFTDHVLAAAGLVDGYFPLLTPLGKVYIAHSATGITAVRQTQTRDHFEQLYRREWGRRAVFEERPPSSLARGVERRLRENSRDVAFDLRRLTAFERAVLMKALEIPLGEVRPYGWIAREIGHPGAVRAVGTALGRNPVPLLIPCHRVVRSDGRMGEYSLGGRENKRVMLAAEGVDPDALEQLARAGVRFLGSDTTHIFCFPTCRHARRTTSTHRVTFPSAAAARSAGYRPCRVCRPAQAAS